jgi:Domain of unknown function (DUF4167)
MNNRQTGRRRGRGNNRAQNNNRNGYDHQNRVDNRARGNAAQMLEKYKKLAQDAQLNGDRVQAEYYHQFADHYFRVLADFRSRQEEGRPQREWRNDDREAGDWREDEHGVENGEDEAISAEEGEETEIRQPQREAERFDRNERGNRNDRGDRNNRGRRDRNERNNRDDNRYDEARGNEAIVEGGLDLSILPPAIGVVANDADQVEIDIEAEAKPARKPRGRRPKAAAADETVAAE